MKKIVLLLCSVLAFSGCRHSTRHSKLISVDLVSMAMRSDNSFKGIVEAFQHKESHGGRVFLRTDPEKRDGIYFSVKFNHTIGLIPAGSKIVLQYITNANPRLEIATWIFPEIKHSLLFRNEIYLGITDDEHYGIKKQLIAWQLEILHPDGHVIAHKESLAW